MLLSRPYWSRIWILQEQVLPFRGMLACGTNSLRASEFWTVLTVLVSVIQFSPLRGSEHILQKLPKHAIQQLRIRGGHVAGVKGARDLGLAFLNCFLGNPLEIDDRNYEGRTLWTLLNFTADFRSTDPRDRLYGLLGLVDPKSCLVLPDYEADVVSVYTRYWKAELSRAGSLDRLIQAGLPYFPETQLLGLPSWVPDFRFLRVATPHAPGASEESNSYGPSQFSWTENVGELVLHGVVFWDEVDKLYPIELAGEEVNPKAVRSNLWAWAQSIMADLKTLPLRPSGIPISIPELLFRVIVEDPTGLDASFLAHPAGQHPATISMAREFIQGIVQAGLDSDSGADEVASQLGVPADARGEVFQETVERLDGIARAKYIASLVEDVVLSPSKMSLFQESVGDQRLASYERFILLRRDLFGSKKQLPGIRSKEGYLGWARGGYMRKGDKLCLIPGVFTPLVLRPLDATCEPQKFSLVGWAYLYGAMRWEVAQVLDDNKLLRQVDICLV